MVREGPAQPPPYPAEKARTEIVMRAWRRRAIFVGGLIAVLVVVWMLTAMR
jgi:hypothetical protein